jgi:thiol-disulfide isomerase/thioredoxin
MKSIERAIRRGPMTIVLVYSPTCPHCHTYMPIWDKLSSQKGRKANLVSMEASTYQQTSLSEKKPVQSVPTVLFIDANGKIVEAKTPRNEEVMSTAVEHGVHETEAATITESPRQITDSSETATKSQPGSEDLPAGTRISENPLIPIPGTPIKTSESEKIVQAGGYRQVGGDSPWAAFTAAMPAALLLGAYALTPKRSSGLPATTRKRRNRKH